MTSERLKELIYRSHRLLFGGQVTGKLEMLREISTEMVKILDDEEKTNANADV